jgi:hypothetical protein
MLCYVLGLAETSPGVFFQMLLKSHGFEKKRDELLWEYHSWCLAQNLAFAAGR